jgi:hypothetical protein
MWIWIPVNSLCQDVGGYRLDQLGRLVAGADPGAGTFLALWPCARRLIFAHIAVFACSYIDLDICLRFMPGCGRTQGITGSIS